MTNEEQGYADAKSGNINSGYYANQGVQGTEYRNGIRRWNREEADRKEALAAQEPERMPAVVAGMTQGADPGLDIDVPMTPAMSAPVAPAPEAPGFSLFGKDLFGNDIVPENRAPLAEKFIIPPFSVLNARDGDWQDRKRAWLAVGIESEVGRGDNLLQMSDTMLEPDPEKRAAMKGKAKAFNTQGLLNQMQGTAGDPDAGIKGGGTSIFDPVLCELAYRWWCGHAGQVVDPFSGGSVRGIIAELCGRRYWGCDLRQEQVDANRAQGKKICPPDLQPVWVCGDSAVKLAEAPEADFIFSCPPYGDLEVYSDDPADLSTMEHADFLKAYYEIIRLSCARLKPDRFAAFVIGDYRDKRGLYRNFVGETIMAFLNAGLSLYNEAILVTPVGTAAMRANGTFSAGRKLVKSHQNVLVFVKGDWKRAAMATGDV